jgi:hypothetical protein
MLIELLDNFRGKSIGSVIEWPDVMAQHLIDAGRAKRAAQQSQEKAMDAPPMDTAMRKPVGKKRA